MKKKQTYVKPRVTKVSLSPEEAVLVGCKQVGGAGGKNERCPPVSGGCKADNGS